MKKYIFVLLCLVFVQAQANTGDDYLFKGVQDNVQNFKTISSGNLQHIINNTGLTKKEVKKTFGNPFIKEDQDQEAWFYGVNINSNEKCLISFVFENGGDVSDFVEMSSEKCEESLTK